jgi:hypothetical protein
MELSDLDRSMSEYEWVMETWLTVPDLTMQESTLIRTFQSSLKKGFEDFDQIRRIALQPAFLPVLKSAVAKAIAAGVLIKWSEYPYAEAA